MLFSSSALQFGVIAQAHLDSLSICSGGVEVCAHSHPASSSPRKTASGRRDGSETEILVNFFDRFHYSSSAKALIDTDVDKS